MLQTISHYHRQYQTQRKYHPHRHYVRLRRLLYPRGSSRRSYLSIVVCVLVSLERSFRHDSFQILPSPPSDIHLYYYCEPLITAESWFNVTLSRIPMTLSSNITAHSNLFCFLSPSPTNLPFASWKSKLYRCRREVHISNEGCSLFHTYTIIDIYYRDQRKYLSN